MSPAKIKDSTPESGPENPRHRVTIVRRPLSAEEEAEASKSKRSQQITFTELKRIFVDGVGNRQFPSDAVLHDMVDKLNREWVRDYKHSPWEVRMAIRIILDGGPAVIQAHNRLSSETAQKDAALYADLLQAAQKIAATNVSIPQIGDKPPKTQRKNSDHRDWWFVFNAVSTALTDAGWTKVGKGDISPAVKISYEILEKIGIAATPEGLAKMLARRPPPKPRD